VTRNEYSFIAEGSDNGAVYECRSSNRPNVPALKKSITLTVKYPAANVFLYGNSTIKRGEEMKLTCVSSPSHPPSIISWTINDAQMRTQPQADKRMAAGIATESNITIDSNTLLSGQKEVVAICTATNEEGSTTQRHIIRVLIPPDQPFIYGADSGPMLEGETLNLTCEATGGNPPAQLSWYRGLEKLRGASAAITGELSSSWVPIKLDRSMNNMPFRCEAENGAIDDPLVASKTINVLFPPRRLILRQAEESRRQMIAGEPAQLSCTVPSSNPPAEINWEFQNAHYHQGRQYSLTSNRTERSQEFAGWQVKHTITFTADEKMDGTIVQCIASHPLWNDAVAAEQKLSIFYPPRLETQGPISVDIEEGSSFQKNLSIISNPPISGWRWKKNDVAFDGTIGSIYVRGSVIGGRTIGPADSGVYTLLASNLFGTVNISMKVTVRYPARIIYITSPVIASVGEDVVLECEADGVPQVKGMVKWMRGDNVMESVIRENKRAVLRLNASHENSGSYICVADNGIGSANYTPAYLLVKKAPQILRNPGFDRAAGPIGGRAKVVCQAVGVPDATFQWSIEGENNVIQYNSSKYLVHETQLDYSTFESTLYILDLNELDYSRRVRCRTFNQLGHDSIYITVSTPSAPDVPTNLEMLKVTNDSITLGWMPGFDGGSEQTFEIQLQKEKNDKWQAFNFTQPRAILYGLEPDKLYYVHIRAINAHQKSSQFSLPVLAVKTLDKYGKDIRRAGTDMGTWEYLGPAVGATIILLCCVNVFICCWKSRNKKRKLHEKTEYVRTTLMNVGDGNVRPVQTYGAVGTPSMRRRPDSSTTNRSELLNDRGSEDDQSVRTMIEVSPNGCMQRYEPNCIVDYDFNPELYSCLNRNMLDTHGVTYAAMPYPEPPRGGLDNVLYQHHQAAMGNYVALEPTDTFTYNNSHADVLVGGASGMSKKNNQNNNLLHHRHESPALSTFTPSGGVRTTTNPSALNGDLV
uniref:Nephrin n=1 Tax=Panagrolaimus sp. ES5 TaxID=591445 RepID=A0AC34FM39_9BILA